MIVDTGQLLIPYGTARVSPGTLAVAAGDDGRLTVECRINHVLIRPGLTPPLRLNSGVLDLSHGALREAPPEAAPLDLVKDRLARHCEVFDKMRRLFLQRYFELIARHLEENGGELDRRLAPFGTLYRREDWTYSALLPLPRAQIPVAKPLGPDAFVSVDFALWTGARLVAINLATGEAQGAAARRDRERLTAAEVAVVDIPRDALGAAATVGLAPHLPRECFRFWEGELFPSGPLKPLLPNAPP